MDNPFLNLFATILDYDNYESRKVNRTDINDYTIDTAYTSDYGYETAIWKNGQHDMAIVERYADKAKAVEGHSKWIKFCKNNPSKVWNIQTEEDFEFDIE